MINRRLSGPGAFPVSLAEAKHQCGVESSEFDGQINTLIAAAGRQLEHFTGLVLGESQYRHFRDTFADEMELDLSQISAVTAVRYYDTAGLARIVDPAGYTLDLVNRPAWVIRNRDFIWPETGPQVNGVEIDFTAGYSPLTCPPDLKLALQRMVHELFDPCSSGSGSGGWQFGTGLAFELAWPYRRLQV